jgi:hypothetical protein
MHPEPEPIDLSSDTLSQVRVHPRSHARNTDTQFIGGSGLRPVSSWNHLDQTGTAFTNSTACMPIAGPTVFLEVPSHRPA